MIVTTSAMIGGILRLGEMDPSKFGEAVGEIVGTILILVLIVYVIYRIIMKVRGKPAGMTISKQGRRNPHSNQGNIKKNKQSKHQGVRKNMDRPPQQWV